jgi:glycosyltransferase involved in cell wall biosynthesis
MKPAVVFDCERMKYPHTGLYTYCYQLGQHLLEARNTEREDIVFYTPAGIASLFPGAGSIAQSPVHKLYMPRLGKYGIWHATHQDSYYLPFRDRQIKVVLTIHDLNFLYDAGKSPPKKQRYLLRLQYLINRADVLVCVSEHSRKDVLAHCNIGQKPLHVILNGANHLSTPMLQSQSYKPAKPFIFSLGAITRKKNFLSLLPLIRKSGPLELVIAGRPEDRDYCYQIMKTANARGIADDVHLVGSISEHEKSWYYRHCRAFALPSVAEGFGLPVVEAMSAGKPLFLSSQTALPEIGGDVAFYFKDFSEAHMQQTFELGLQQYDRLDMEQQIINKGKEFSWQKAAHAYWQLYRSLY